MEKVPDIALDHRQLLLICTITFLKSFGPPLLKLKLEYGLHFFTFVALPNTYFLNRLKQTHQTCNYRQLRTQTVLGALLEFLNLEENKILSHLEFIRC